MELFSIKIRCTFQLVSTLHDKGLMSDFDFEKMKLEYENRNKKDIVINPVNRILKMK